MKKYIKLVFVIVVALVGIILLDTLQARIFKHSPLISWKQKLTDEDSWVDKGILIDTYYCTKEKDIVTVTWKFKTSKFTCSIDNNELENISISIKDKTLTKTGATIIITDLSGNNNIYGDFFRIDKKTAGKWKELETIIENFGFNAIGYTVDENNKLELVHNWEWLYGKLKEGEYRLVKQVNNQYISVEFEID